MVRLALLMQLTLPSPLPPVLQLAQVFSASSEAPRCQRRGPSGEDLGSPLAMYCVWNVAAPDMQGARLAARIAGPGGPTLVLWEFETADVARASRLADSVGTYLQNHGFVPKTCEDGTGPAGRIVAVQWRTDGLTVHVSHLLPAAGYKAKLGVMVTDVPDVIHPILCQ